MAKVTTVSQLEYDLMIKTKNQIIKWLIVALVITQMLWASTWIVFWLTPVETIETTETIYSETGSANYIKGNGDIING